MSIEQVAQFNQAFGVPVAGKVPEGNWQTREELRATAGMLKATAVVFHDIAKKRNCVLARTLHLMLEELGETLDAIHKNDREALLDGLLDLDYVNHGAALQFGFTPEQYQDGARRVHAANMSKLDNDGKPIKDESGRVLKGPNFKAPDLSDLV